MGKQQKIIELRNYISGIEPQIEELKRQLILEKSLHGIDDDTKVFPSVAAVKVHNLSQMIDELQVTLDFYNAEINTTLNDK